MVPGPHERSRGGRLLAKGHVQAVAKYSHSHGPSLVISDPDISGAGSIVGRSVFGRRRKMLHEVLWQ